MAATATLAYAPHDVEAPSTPAVKLYMMPALADMRGAETYLTRKGWYNGMEDRLAMASRLRRSTHTAQRMHAVATGAYSNASSADEASDCEDCASYDEMCPNPACLGPGARHPNWQSHHATRSRMHQRGNVMYNAYMMSAYDVTSSPMHTRAASAPNTMSDANTFCMFSMDGLDG